MLSKAQAKEDRRGHHVFFYIYVDGKLHRATKISHNARGQISPSILNAIAHQMRLTLKELKSFISCTIEREIWLDSWRQRGHGWWK